MPEMVEVTALLLARQHERDFLNSTVLPHLQRIHLSIVAGWHKQSLEDIDDLVRVITAEVASLG